MERNNKWLVLANPNRCRHTDCLHKEGFVSWVQKTYPFEMGDIVYLYINGAVRFKKKTQKTPQSEINKAIQIKKEYYAGKK